jgi:hypothetical protein
LEVSSLLSISLLFSPNNFPPGPPPLNFQLGPGSQPVLEIFSSSFFWSPTQTDSQWVNLQPKNLLSSTWVLNGGETYWINSSSWSGSMEWKVELRAEKNGDRLSPMLSQWRIGWKYPV